MFLEKCTDCPYDPFEFEAAPSVLLRDGQEFSSLFVCSRKTFFMLVLRKKIKEVRFTDFGL